MVMNDMADEQNDQNISAIEFLQLLAEEGGAIVSSNECTTEEISDAQAEGRFYADSEGYGYVHNPFE